MAKFLFKIHPGTAFFIIFLQQIVGLEKWYEGVVVNDTSWLVHFCDGDLKWVDKKDSIYSKIK